MSNFTSPTSSSATMNSNNTSFYSVTLSDKMGPDMMRMIEDLVRMLVIQVTIQFLLFLTDSCNYAFFTPEFIVLLIYIAIAVMLYWLIFKKIIQFV